MQRVLATSRDEHHCTCINQSSPSPTENMTSKIMCSIRESNQILWKEDSTKSQEAQEGPADITTGKHLLFDRHYAKHFISSVYSSLPASSVIGRDVLESACTS